MVLHEVSNKDLTVHTLSTLCHTAYQNSLLVPFSVGGWLTILFVSASGSLDLFAICRLAAVGLSAIFF